MDNESLSANTLFNFTKEFEYLKSKIENGFKPRLVLEGYHSTLGKEIEIAVPMVCFCDIRLSQILTHVEEYGDYGIGLEKEWAMKKRVEPLIYALENSTPIKIFKNFVNKKSNTQERKNVLRFIAYLKPYSGMQNGKNRNFYNEREWRFVPNVDLDTYSLEKKEFEEEIKKNDKNCLLFENSGTGLDFDFKDIKYIILKHRSEISDVVKIIRNRFHSVNEADVYENIVFLTKEAIEKDL